jgi:biopolymer transport protein ExbD
MAEMDTSSGGGHKKGPGVKKGKKLSTRVDLTPMVDLGFLLITFFLFTTTLAKPKVMQIVMPYKDKNLDEKDQSQLKADQAMTILLSKDHRIYYYDGIGDKPDAPPDVKVTYFKPTGGIRDIIIDKINRVKQLQAQGILNAKNDAAFLIKPDVTSTYDDFVRIMDEMNINDVKIKAVVDISPVDQEFIRATEAANGIPATPAADTKAN